MHISGILTYLFCSAAPAGTGSEGEIFDYLISKWRIFMHISATITGELKMNI